MRSQKAPAIADEQVREILEKDRAWAAYALADLALPWSEYSEWSVRGGSLLLTYRGLSPPVLFAAGEPAEMVALFESLSPGRYWYTLRPTDFSLMQDRAHDFTRTHMWRMRLVEDSFMNWIGPATRLESADEEQIDRLFGSHRDRPDAYSPEQIENGVYFGIFEGEALISVAGTHVVDRLSGAAAVGNIFTAPQQRRQGYGIRASANVVKRLVELELETIVLNVEMANQVAIEMYMKLGFVPYCGFYEGIAVLT